MVSPFGLDESWSLTVSGVVVAVCFRGHLSGPCNLRCIFSCQFGGRAASTASDSRQTGCFVTLPYFISMRLPVSEVKHFLNLFQRYAPIGTFSGSCALATFDSSSGYWIMYAVRPCNRTEIDCC